MYLSDLVSVRKKEADEPDGLIDLAITFEELKIWINDQIPDISQIQKDDRFEFVPYSAHEGALYPIDGGMNTTIRKIGIKDEAQLLEICSIPAFEKALNNLEPEKLNRPIFVEALACEGGCIAGPCISTDKASISIVSDVLTKVKKRDDIPKNNRLCC